MKLRTTYPGFTDAVNSFFDQLIKKVVPHQVVSIQAQYEFQKNLTYRKIFLRNNIGLNNTDTIHMTEMHTHS